MYVRPITGIEITFYTTFPLETGSLRLAPRCTRRYNVGMARRSQPAPDRAKHGRRQLSDEQRRQLSVRAKKMHAEGKIGGKEFGRLGGRPRVKRASEAVSEAAEKHSAEIVAALRAGVRQGSPEARSRSATRWLEAAQREDALQLRKAESEQKQQARLSRDEMINQLAARLTAGPIAGLLRERLTASSAVIDGEAVEVLDAQ